MVRLDPVACALISALISVPLAQGMRDEGDDIADKQRRLREHAADGHGGSLFTAPLTMGKIGINKLSTGSSCRNAAR